MDGNQTLKYGLLHGRLLGLEEMSGDLGWRLFNKLNSRVMLGVTDSEIVPWALRSTKLFKLTERVTANGYRGPEEDHFELAAHPRP